MSRPGAIGLGGVLFSRVVRVLVLGGSTRV